ncbi:M56 family metallopeptidase [Catellatospora coxensis]
MFDHFAWSVLVAPALVSIALRLVADRLPPGRGAYVVAWSAAATAAASLANLLVFALKAVAQVPAVGTAFGWSAHTVHQDTAHVAWAPILSVGLLTASVTAVSVSTPPPPRARRGPQPHRRHRHRPGAARRAPRGVRGAGPPGRIVVTTAMREHLTATQLDAVIAHEQAHLDAGHHRLVALADLAAVGHPALWWVARHVGYLVERDADEQAARAVGNRRTVAHAIGRASLAAPRPGAGTERRGPGRGDPAPCRQPARPAAARRVALAAPPARAGRLDARLDRRSGLGSHRTAAQSRYGELIRPVSGWTRSAGPGPCRPGSS